MTYNKQIVEQVVTRRFRVVGAVRTVIDDQQAEDAEMKHVWLLDVALHKNKVQGEFCRQESDET